MSHKRIPKRKAAIAAGGVVALGAAAILLPNANASQDAASDAAPRTLKAADASQLAARLAGALGDAFAGSYYDAGGRQLVVNVVAGDNDNVIVQAERAGAKVREVRNSLAALRTGAQTLRSEAAVPGTAWAVDPRTNKILVTADRTVTGGDWDRLESTVKGLGSGIADVKRSKGTFKTFLSGGDAIFAGGARCSAGFNVTAGDGTPAFLTAGHCGVAAAQWSDSQGGRPIATVDQATFPGAGDFALVKYDDPATQAPSEVNVGQQTVAISQAADAAVGLQVFRMGSTTGLNNGQVTGVDATVNYPEGTVTGLIQTDVCAEPGDSGGSLFTQDGLAIGLTSGGSGDCTVGGETFFQPVTTALQAVGATLGDGAGGAGAGAGAGQGAGDQAGQGAGDGAGDQAGQGAGAGAGAGDQAGAGQEAGAGQGPGAGQGVGGGNADGSGKAGAPGSGDGLGRIVGSGGGD
ncbi:protease precursor [Streptomyces zinciresistens K42]|uniref:Protease n=1 Tax=Streptomyces zinciresistens K42 TaxID=700597 RepID=G2GIR1_9ACTN|nr:S1 family peptidase [Streptomyces zinciresistens]EGX56607.1 protease precursor [Streptomyces zinciresistens K42]